MLFTNCFKTTEPLTSFIPKSLQNKTLGMENGQNCAVHHNAPSYRQHPSSRANTHLKQKWGKWSLFENLSRHRESQVTPLQQFCLSESKLLLHSHCGSGEFSEGMVGGVGYQCCTSLRRYI